MTKEATMSKFNNTSVRARNGNGYLMNTEEPAPTFNGGDGYVRTNKSELFLAVVSDFGGEKTFYETADVRSKRIAGLVRKIAVEDLDWLTNLATWLRNEANMRSISITVALEGAKALNDAGIPGGRPLVSGAILRADEPGEALAYWFANFGRKLPSAVKRGIADAAVKAFNPYSLAKYDTPSKGFRFGDVIELTHPNPKDVTQSALFKFAMERRRNTAAVPDESLRMLSHRAAVLGMSDADKRALILSDDASDVLKLAGLTWEAVAGTFGKGGLDGKAWEALIPTMGYMALLRNLRNFEEKGVSSKVLDQVAIRISDPDEVAKSRQLPFRFLSAHRAVTGTTHSQYNGQLVRGTAGSLRFVYPLEQALNASLTNVPSLKGSTLILVDRSGSMFQPSSDKSTLSFADSAALFGSALAVRAENATLVQFGTSSKEVPFKKSSSVLSMVDGFDCMGGTRTAEALRTHYKGHERVVLITDEQQHGAGPMEGLSPSVKGYTWNLAGYRSGSMASGPNRTYLGGLTDQAFKLIPLVEAGRDQKWPWL